MFLLCSHRRCRLSDLPRYAREWNYRFNRRTRIADLADFVLRRAMARPTTTYRTLVNGLQPQGALPALTG